MKESAMNTSDIRVLVVDDEEHIRLTLMAFLEDEGFDVTEAASAEAGLEILALESFSVGIIDMRLPGMDGNDFIQNAHEFQPEMKFLIHTGSSEYVLPQDLKKIGLKTEHVIKKPVVDMAVFTDYIQRLLGNL